MLKQSGDGDRTLTTSGKFKKWSWLLTEFLKVQQRQHFAFKISCHLQPDKVPAAELRCIFFCQSVHHTPGSVPRNEFCSNISYCVWSRAVTGGRNMAEVHGVWGEMWAQQFSFTHNVFMEVQVDTISDGRTDVSHMVELLKYCFKRSRRLRSRGRNFKNPKQIYHNYKYMQLQVYIEFAEGFVPKFCHQNIAQVKLR